MTHDPFRDDIGPYLDNELAAARSRQVEAHLAGCPECSAEAEALGRVGANLKSLPRDRMPAELKARILAKTRAPAIPAWRGRPWALASLASAALVVVVVVAGWPGPPERPAVGQNSSAVSPEMPRKARPKASVLKTESSEESKNEADAPARMIDAGDRARSRDERAASEPGPEEERSSGFAPAPPAAPAAEAVGKVGSKQDVPGSAGAEASDLLDRSGAARFAGRYRAELEGTAAEMEIGPLVAIVLDKDGDDHPPVTITLMPREGVPSASVSNLRVEALREQNRPSPESRPSGPLLMTYVLRVDADGTILSAQQVGARTVPAELADRILRMLRSGRLSPYESGAPGLLTVEIAVPSGF